MRLSLQLTPRAPRLDKRYKIFRQFAGYARPVWAVYFCEDRLGHANTRREARELALAHRADCIAVLEGRDTTGRATNAVLRANGVDPATADPFDAFYLYTCGTRAPSRD